MIVGHIVAANDDWLVYAGLAILALGAARLAGLAADKVPESVGVGLIIVGAAIMLVETLMPAVTSATRPVAGGTVRITEPGDGTRLTTPKVVVAVETDGFTLENPGSTRPARTRHGHLHVLVDGTVVSMPSRADVEVCIPEGRHVIQAELVAEDHAAFRDAAGVTRAVSVIGAPGATCP